MKKLNLLLAILLLGLVAIQTGCKKDDDKPKVALKMVLVERSSGDLYTIDEASWTLEKTGHITFNGDSLKGLRSLVYDPETKLAYGGMNCGSSLYGQIFKINLKTGVVTLLNDNPDDQWCGVTDMILDKDTNPMAIVWSSKLGASSLLSWDKVTGDTSTTHFPITDGVSADFWDKGGITYGSSGSEVVVGGVGEFHFCNTQGLITETVDLQNSTTMNAANMRIMDFERFDNKLYAIIINFGDVAVHYQFLVEIDINSGAVTELIQLGEAVTYHCLATVPEDQLPAVD